MWFMPTKFFKRFPSQVHVSPNIFENSRYVIQIFHFKQRLFYQSKGFCDEMDVFRRNFQ